MSLIKTFAEKHRLRVRQRADGERIIPGRDGEIYQASRSQVAVIFMPPRWTPRRWNANRNALVALGMTCTQDGDSEGTLLFDPANQEQARAAIKLAHVRRRRVLTAEQAAAGAKRLQAARQNRSAHT